jgi:hypothetical protein
MHFQAYVLATLGVGAVAHGVSNPHHKAQQVARPQPVRRAPEVPRLEKRQTSQWLNNKTERESRENMARDDLTYM